MEDYRQEPQEDVVYINLPPNRVWKGIQKRMDKEYGRGNYTILQTVPLGSKRYKILYKVNATFKGKKRLKGGR